MREKVANGPLLNLSRSHSTKFPFDNSFPLDNLFPFRTQLPLRIQKESGSCWEPGQCCKQRKWSKWPQKHILWPLWVQLPFLKYFSLIRSWGAKKIPKISPKSPLRTPDVTMAMPHFLYKFLSSIPGRWGYVLHSLLIIQLSLTCWKLLC